MKLNIILSSEEIEEIVIAHVKASGFDTINKSLDVEFKFDGEQLEAFVNVEDVSDKPKRTGRTFVKEEPKDSTELFN